MMYRSECNFLALKEEYKCEKKSDCDAAEIEIHGDLHVRRRQD